MPKKCKAKCNSIKAAQFAFVKKWASKMLMKSTADRNQVNTPSVSKKQGQTRYGWNYT